MTLAASGPAPRDGSATVIPAGIAPTRVAAEMVAAEAAETEPADGAVDFADLNIVRNNFGRNC